jgi:hypothetical protein
MKTYQQSVRTQRRAVAREQVGYLLDYCNAHDTTTPPRLEFLTIADIEDHLPKSNVYFE